MAPATALRRKSPTRTHSTARSPPAAPCRRPDLPSPSPLVGEGGGGGCQRADSSSVASPPPQPSPIKGEGEDSRRGGRPVGPRQAMQERLANGPGDGAAPEK